MKRLLCLLIPIFIFTSCEKDIEVDLDKTPPKLVVEATIENGTAPVVILTNSFNYFATISPQLLSASFVHNAEVFISNGTLTHKLKEYTVTPAPGIELSYYSIDSSNLSTAFTGVLNHTYTLEIRTGGQTYTSSTTIPNITKVIDSLWWKPAPGRDSATKAIIMVRATDPPGFGDYIRYFTKTNSDRFLPPFTSAYDDLFVDGTTYEIQVAPGIDRNAETIERSLFNRGDTITFKLSNIDKATFDFWRTMEFSYASIGNPFSTPTTIKSNISNEALGYFGGYASQFRTLILRP